MTINMRRYVDITSGVGGGATVRQRELIGMLFTTDPRVPVDAVVEMESASDVMSYFGAGSPEYLRAAFYFDFVSKTITAPKKIAFTRYSPDATAAAIYGSRAVLTMSTWKAITAGSLTLIVGGVTSALTALDFSAAVSLADVASTLQAAIRQQTGAAFTAATVAFDVSRAAFNFTSGATGKADIAIGSSGATDIAGKLGWTGSLTVFSPGTDAEEPVEAFTRSADRNNNFGSFAFIPVLTLEQIVAVAQANSGRNVEFMYCIRTTAEDAQAVNAALIDLSGVGVTLAPNEAEYDEMAPMILLAATDYTRRNGTQNYMYQQFNLTAKVDSNLDADYYDPLRVNYMGVTQTGGQLIKFYQRGVMMGVATAPVDMNIYANEMWFKDTASAALMTMLLALPKVPANTDGRGQVIAILQGPIEAALSNGTISVGKALTIPQRLYVTQMTGDEDAWHQVQAMGYWLDCAMQSYTTEDGRTEWKAVYVLIYSKDDLVRKIEGTHILV